MTTREKIIVGIMCLTIVYGAYELFGSRRQRNHSAPVTTKNTIDDLKSFVADVTGKLVGEKVSKEYQYMIQQAGTQWNKDPFIHSSRPLKKRLLPTNLEPKKPPKRITPKFVYTGYMQLGDSQFAIVNGIEYKEGEALPDKKYYIKSISPNSIVIGKIDGLETIQVYLSETDS